MLALMNSLFILAILSKDIPFGHSTSQAPVLEQFPNPSKSIWATTEASEFNLERLRAGTEIFQSQGFHISG